MTDTNESAPDPDRETPLQRLQSLSQLPQARLDANFYHLVDDLRTAVEALDIAMHGCDIDRRIVPADVSRDELLRRWAAQLVILRSIFMGIERDALKIHAAVRSLLAMD